MAEFKRGSQVLYKNPDGEEVGARVLSYRPSTKEYNLSFANGETKLVKPSTISADPTAERGRMAKSTSPGRTLSRGRGRSRTRSPARSTSKGRKSAPVPGGKSAAATKRDEKPVEKPKRRSVKPDKEEQATAEKPAEKKPKDEPKEKAPKPAASNNAETSTSRRKSMRIAALEAEAKTAGTKKPADPTAVKVSLSNVGGSAAGKIAGGASWLAILGALVCTVAIPTSFVAVNMMCDKKNCTVRMLSVPKRLATFYDKNAWFGYAGFAVLQAVLLLLPIGKRSEGPVTPAGRFQYRFNGWLSLMATLGALFGLQKYAALPIELVRTKFFALLTASWVFGLFLSVVAYVKARVRPSRNTYFRGQTGNVLVDWHAGRETIPRLGSRFDLKLFAVRLSANGLAVVIASLVYSAYNKTGGQLPYQMYVAAALGLFYVLDFQLRENDYLTTFDYLKTGSGYAFFSTAALYPFIASLPIRFLHDQLEHKLLVELQAPVLAGLVSLFLVGYLLFLVSNRIKNAFRRDPNSKRFADLETIPTSKGKALIVSGPWGWVRRPNYVGDLVMSVAYVATTGFGHVTPFVIPLGLLSVFLLRSYDDETRLKQKYGSAWTRYCQRVPYRFIPKVY